MTPRKPTALPRKPRLRITTELRRRIAKLSAQGLHRQAIADELGVCYSTVAAIQRREEIPHAGIRDAIAVQRAHRAAKLRAATKGEPPQ